MAITLEQAIELINEKRSNEQKRHIKTFEEDEKLELLNGRYGPYIAYDGKNYRIPKAKQENVEALTYDECMTIIKEAPSQRLEAERSKLLMDGSLLNEPSYQNNKKEMKSIIIIGYMG